MKKKLAIILSLVLVTGCSTTPKTPQQKRCGALATNTQSQVYQMHTNSVSAGKGSYLAIGAAIAAGRKAGQEVYDMCIG